MEQFFEAWVETVMRAVSQRTGGLLKVGRRRETVSAFAFEPPYVGSQRSLIPDLILEMEDVAVVVDAKYKRHWASTAGKDKTKISENSIVPTCCRS